VNRKGFTMKTHLNAIDPLPKLEGYCVINGMPESQRQLEEWSRAKRQADGEDWHPTETKGIERNGKGQYRTVDYKPPEPPETDIPIPCVVEIGDRIKELARLIGGAWAEPQTQAASQMTVDTGSGFFELDRLYSKADAWQAVYPRGLLTTGHMQTFCAPQYRPQAEPQTQAASQIKQKVRTKYLVRDATGRTVGVTYDPDLWIPHTPGDQAPVKDGTRVMFKRRCDGPKGTAFFGGIESQPGHWTKAEQEMYEVTAWRPA
jgi:hypothetical protein